jgi:hemolysin D
MSAQAQQRHPALELLTRYKAVLQAAWQARHELAGPKRLADEAAFLPAALSLQESPPHPAPRRALWAIMGLFVIALLWACVGQVDIVAVAPGRIVVSEGTKLIQPLEASVVTAIKVKDGDHVEAGQVLVELDATAPMADRTSLQEQREAARSEAARSRALLHALASGRPPQADQPADRAQLQSEWADLSARQAQQAAEIARREAELQTVRAGLAKLEATLPLAQQREADFRTLSEQGFVAGHAGQDRTRERIELERDLATQRARLQEAQAALHESQQERQATLAETRRTLNERLAQASLKHTQLQQEGAKAEQRERLTSLKAPVAGTVQQLAVRTTGGVVTPAQTLLVIVPDAAEVNAEVTIDNKDIGFVHEGQEAQVKLETFPFTRYGTVPAQVRRVSADAVMQVKEGQPQNAIFPATLQLQQTSVNVDGKRIKLTPGMNLTAEIKTGRRRVIDYLLSPVQTAVSESLGER